VTGLSFAYCSFTRRARTDFIRTSSAPAKVGSATTAEKSANSE